MVKQHGQTVVITKVNTLKIKKKVKALLYGAMGKNILANGKQGNRMGKEFIFHQMESKEREFGKMESVFNG